MAPLNAHYDVAVIGAGPAGMSAAATAAAFGLSAVLFDEQSSLGGQIYRGITEAPERTREALGPDYRHGTRLVDALKKSAADIALGATVWNIDPKGEMAVSRNGKVSLVNARHLIVASGAQERPFPIPGWTLPGVMTAGGAQTLIKQADLVPDGRAVLAGTGPLLWLLAWQILRAGGRLEAILDTTPAENWRAARAHLPAFLRSSYWFKGLRLMGMVRRRVRAVTGIERLEARGHGRLEHVAYRVAGGPERTLPADLLLLHQGVVPGLHLADTLGCEIGWNEEQACFQPRVDLWGRSSMERVSIAGDGAGIAGARAAARRGKLAALDAAQRLGAISVTQRDEAGREDLAWLMRDGKARRFLDILYRPAVSFRTASGDTIVCRCEEVSARRVEEAIRQNALGPNQTKFFLRCGMGPCQGRMCGLTVTEMFAAARHKSPGEIGHYRLRTPIKPVTVAEVASLPASDHARKAVVRL